MENYKVKVNGNIEELISLFSALGCKYFNHTVTEKNYMLAEDGKVFFCKLKSNFKKSACQEVTIDQLRDMVVLKRNDVGDANAYCNDNSEHYYISSDGKYFYYLEGYESSKWMHSSNHISYLEKHVKPIEKPMKEFLNKLEDGTYKLVVLDSVADGVKGLIEVPDGADSFRVFYVAPDGGEFYKENSAMYFDKNYNRWSGVSRSIETLNTHSRTVWQRGRPDFNGMVEL